MKNFKKLALVAAAACTVALSNQNAFAVASLTLSSGTNTVTVVDQGSGDSGAPVGQVTFNGVIGVWTVNVSTGLTKPIMGSSTTPNMDLNSINFSSAAGTLTIRFTDDGFNTAGGSAFATWGGTLGGGAGSSITYKTYQVIGGVTNLLTSIGASATPFSGVGSAPTAASTNYSLIQEVVITHAAQGNTSFDATLQVPDGGMTAALLGMGLLGVEAVRRKLKA